MIKTETLLGEKLRRGGLVPREFRLGAAISEFLNNGGTVQRAHELVDLAACEMGSEAASLTPEGLNRIASAPPPYAAKGQKGYAERVGSTLPNAAPQRSAGRISSAIAGNASDDLPVASPRNRPGHAKRGAKAIAAVQATMSKSLFDTTVLPDGRRLREVRWAECPIVAAKYRRLSRIIMAVHNTAVPPDPNTTLDNIVTEDTLKEIIASVERFNDIH